MSNKIKCTCGHSWNKSSSSKKDMNICHVCGKDTTMQMGGFVYPVNYVPQAEDGEDIDDPKPSYWKNKVYKGPTEFKECKGEGCSKQATKGVASLYDLDYSSLNPQDAWYKRSAVIKGGGKEIYNTSSKNDVQSVYGDLRVGDFVSLDRPGDRHAKDVSKVEGYTLDDNEQTEHLGYVVGFNDDGVPLVKHGHEGNLLMGAKSFVQPITDLSLPDIGYNYKVKSIYRAKPLLENDSRELKSPYYKNISPSIPLTFYDDKNATADKKKFMRAYNKNSDKFQTETGLSPEEVAAIGNIGYGIFGNESRFNESVKRPVKQIAAEALYALGLRKTPPSLGPTQLKYDQLTSDKNETRKGKLLRTLGVDKDDIDNVLLPTNYNAVAKATFATLADNYKNLKSNPKFQYNPDDNTVLGNVPIGLALAKSWQNPSLRNVKKSLQEGDSDYANNVYRNMAELEGNTFPVNLPEVVVKGKKKKNGGWLDAPQAENGIEGTMGGLTDQGFDYNGAWGGPSMQMGGAMPGSVGFTYARTKGIPSEGPYAKKTMPSAQNGQEMKFYQEGLDWKPKNISMNGSKTPKAQAGWQEKLAKEAAKLDNPLSTFQLMKKGYSKDEIKTIQNASNKEQPKVGTPKGKQLSKEEILEKNKANIEARNIERGAETLTNAADYALGLPGRLAQSAYKPGYTAEDAFLNKPSGAGFLEEMIADPSNLASFGLKGLAKGVLKGLGKKAVGKGLLSSVPLTFYKSIDRDPALMQAFYDNLAKVKETISTPTARDAFRRVGEVATRRPGSVDIDPMYAAAITDPDLPVKAIDRFAQSLISTNAAENALTADQLKYLSNVGSVATDFKRIDSSLPLKDRIRFAIDNSKNISPRDILPYFYQQGNLATSDKDELVKLLYDSYGGQPVNNPIAEYTAAADLFGLADTYDQQRYSTLSNDVKHEIRRLTESAEAARPELRIADEYFDPNRSNRNNEEAIHLLSRGYYPGIPTAEERTRNMRSAGKQVVQTVNDIISNPQNRGKSYVGAHSLSTDSYPLQLGLLGRQQGNVDYFPVHTGSASSIYPDSNPMSGLSAHNSNRRNQLIQAKSMFDKNIGNIQSNSNSFRGTNLAGTKQLQGQMLESGLLNAAIADFNKKVGTNMPSAYFSAYENDILRPNVGITIRKDGGPVKDDMGYWNPENWGEPVEIGSNEITMQGVDQDLVGVSDKGDVKYMKANNPNNYKFKGKKVTEYPVKKNGGWLDKYN